MRALAGDACQAEHFTVNVTGKVPWGVGALGSRWRAARAIYAAVPRCKSSHGHCLIEATSGCNLHSGRLKAVYFSTLRSTGTWTSNLPITAGPVGSLNACTSVPYRKVVIIIMKAFVKIAVQRPSVRGQLAASRCRVACTCELARTDLDLAFAPLKCGRDEIYHACWLNYCTCGAVRWTAFNALLSLE